MSKNNSINTSPGKNVHDFSDGLDDLRKLVSEEEISIEFLAGDGSDRTYHRIFSSDNKPVAVIMKVSDADNTKIVKGTYDWVGICSLLQKSNLVAPKILGSVPSVNALVIEDFGNFMLESFTKEANPDETFKVYKKAIDVIISMIAIPYDSTHVWTTRSFDYEKLSFEMNFLKKHYLFKAVSLNLTPDEIKSLDQDIDALCKYLESYSKYFTHRDFHSRNILLHNNEIGLIDFQDARLGPPSYDIVSLVFDPYVDIDFNKRIDLLDYFINSSSDEDLRKEISETYKPMALQRLLKAIGSFGYLTLTVKRGDYLGYVPKAVALIKKLGVEDQRWPFISGKLIDKLVELND